MQCCCWRFPSPMARLIHKMKFWKLFLYVLFLIYPGVSSFIIRHLICREIDGVEVIQTDPSVKCSGDTYFAFWIVSIILLAVYPFGIPVFFWVSLYRHRDHLENPRIRAQYGFLYGGYKATFWWWELVDMWYKLIMICVLASFGIYQLQLGMGLVTLYTFLILGLTPYVRPDDDRLHLLVNVVIFTMLEAANVAAHQTSLNDENSDVKGYDGLISFVLVMVCIEVFCIFCYQGGVFIKEIFIDAPSRKRLAQQKRDKRILLGRERPAAKKI